MSDEAIPSDIELAAFKAVEAGREQATKKGLFAGTVNALGVIEKHVARAILAERNRVHKQLKGEGE